VRRTDADVIVRQYRPTESEFSIPNSDIRVMYRIVGVLDLR
jgi:hypothetical protein